MADATEILPRDPAQGIRLNDLEKAEDEHVEYTAEYEPRRDFTYHSGEDETKPRKGLKRLLRKNPSADFMREVAEANEHELDPTEVKQVSFLS
jgi:hypothetical protein